MSDFLEERILQQDLRDQGIRDAIRHVIDSSCVETVAALAKRSYLSKRQFERKFKEYAGFSPKLFTMIIRFNYAYMLCKDKSRSLLDIAHSCGYYDQAHFNRDFKMFAGFQPREIFRPGR